MKTPTSSLFVLLMSTLALASTTNNQITEIKGNSNSVSNSASGNHIKASANVNAARRSLASLFRRDPEFEFAMGILERNAKAADQTVDQIVAAIHAGTVPPEIEKAARFRGLYTTKLGSIGKRSALKSSSKGMGGGNSAHISGPKGQAHSETKVAQHLMAGGPVPDKIKAAIIASEKYLAPGQTRDNPTAPPGRGKGRGASRAGAASASGAGRGGETAPALTARDLSGLYSREISDVYVRDLDSLYERDPPELYERDFDDLYERDLDGLYERDMDALIERELNEFFAREADKVTTDQIVALANAIQRDPHAKHAVYKALTMDPNVEKVTEQLVADWTTEEDLQKREAEAEAYYDALEARDAEAEAEAEE